MTLTASSNLTLLATSSFVFSNTPLLLSTAFSLTAFSSSAWGSWFKHTTHAAVHLCCVHSEGHTHSTHTSSSLDPISVQSWAYSSLLKTSAMEELSSMNFLKLHVRSYIKWVLCAMNECLHTHKITWLQLHGPTHEVCVQRIPSFYGFTIHCPPTHTLIP